MVKYFLGILTGILLILVLCVVAVVIAMTAGGSSATVADKSVLELNLTGPVRENVASEFDLSFLRSGPPPTVLGLRSTLLHAAEDSNISALALNCGGLAVGWGKAQELRWQIEKFKESGKPVMAFMQVAGTMDYFVCSAADEIYMEPEGMLDMKGLRAEVAFYKDTFEKIGVDVEMERIGKYKSAAEPYTQTGMSEAYREVTNSILDEILAQLSDTIAPSRKITPEQFRAALDDGPFQPDGAQKAGLIDGLLYRDQFEDKLAGAIGVDEIETVSHAHYAKANQAAFNLGGKKQIAIVYGVGAILRGRSESDPLLGVETLGADSLVEAMEQARDNDDVQAIILRIDSPGGDAIASDQMWRALALASAKKPVVVSMSDVAASGGYYMAMAKNVPVLAYPGCYTGSIGVFFGKLNLRGLYEKIGLKKDILTRGRYAAIDSDYRPLTEDERAKLRQGVEKVYDSFVTKVADARGMDWDATQQVAQGRVWLGSQAVKVGLVDELGGLDRAIALVKEKAGLGADEDVDLIAYPKPKRLIEVLLEQNGMVQAPALPAFLRERLRFASAWPALAEGGVLALSPYALTVQ
ncbi:MAG: signal peptide peptidase SppA [Acidobacteria bacterium]|nr:signal peptide peptidase SppA [Acidobacteriota bacterium]